MRVGMALLLLARTPGACRATRALASRCVHTALAPRTRSAAPRMLEASQPQEASQPPEASLPQEAVAALAFDLETTGRDPHSNEIVQIAIVCANSLKPTPPSFTRLVLPEGPIDPGAQAVHGYSRERLLDEGARSFEEVWAEAEEWIEGTFQSTRPLVWCAHNGHRFDRPILTRSVAALSAQGTATQGRATGSSHNPVGPSLGASLAPSRAVFVDTLPMARAAFPNRSGPGSHTLGRLYADALRGESTLENAHDALADANALVTVWRWLVEEMRVDSRAENFQQHLQELAYGPRHEPTTLRRATRSTRTRSTRTSSTRTSALSGGSLGSAIESSVDTTLLTSVPGVGDVISKRLQAKGIMSAQALHELWVERGRDPQKMRGWLVKSMPGVSPFALYKVVSGLVERERTQTDLSP